MFPVLGGSPVMFQSPRNGLLCARTGAAAAKPAAAIATSRTFCSRKVTSRARTGRRIAGVHGFMGFMRFIGWFKVPEAVQRSGSVQRSEPALNLEP